MFKQLRELVIAILFVLVTNSLQAQKTISIGAENINENAVLQLVSTDKNQGFLVPRLSGKERSSMLLNDTKDGGMIVYDTDVARFYYWHNKEWHRLKIAYDAATESDPIFQLSVASKINSSDAAYWNNKLDNYTETDSAFIESIAFRISYIDTSYWNNKLNIFIENDSNYLSSITFSITAADTARWNSSIANFVEMDPIFERSVASSITEADTNKWNNKLTSEVDGSVTNEIQTLLQVLTQSNLAEQMQIKNLSNPISAQDAATRAYVDQMLHIMANLGISGVDFTADNTNLAIGEVVNFIDNSEITPTGWAWDFGDGNTSTEQNPAHVYVTTGAFSVSLIASIGIFTYAKTKTNYIKVNGPGAGVTDIDANFYPSIIIGEQEWMAENLKVTHYPNGDEIPLVTDNTAWGRLADNNRDDAYSYYANSQDSLDKYGALYTYAAAIGDNWAKDNVANQGVCPDNWHLPTDEEWTELESYISKDHSGTEGTALKAITGCNSNGNGTDDYGFSALPGGNRNRSNGTFNYAGNYGTWWSSTESSSGSVAYGRNLGYSRSYVHSYGSYKSVGFSLRCVRD